MSAASFSLLNKNSFINKLLPAPLNGGFYLPNDWIWGASVIRGEDGRYHSFASRVPGELTFTPHWCTNSVIVRGGADTPEGPFRYEEEVLPNRGKEFWDGMMSHNPTIQKYKDNYLFFDIGTTHEYEMPTPEKPADREKYKQARANQRIGLANSKSVYGPWKRLGEPVLQPRQGKWDALMTTNPVPCLRHDGSVLLVHKSYPFTGRVVKIRSAVCRKLCRAIPQVIGRTYPSIRPGTGCIKIRQLNKTLGRTFYLVGRRPLRADHERYEREYLRGKRRRGPCHILRWHKMENIHAPESVFTEINMGQWENNRPGQF